MRWVYVVPALTTVIVGASEVAVSTVVLALRKSVQIHKEHDVEKQKRKWSIALLWLCGRHLNSLAVLSLHKKKNYLIIHRTVQNWVTSTWFLFLPSITCSIIFLLSWWIFVATGRFLANFGNITQIIKNWKHWLRVQNLPIRYKVCVLCYMASSCAVLSNFTTICAQKLTSWGHPKWIIATTSFYYFGIIGCLLLFSKLFQDNVHSLSTCAWYHLWILLCSGMETVHFNIMCFVSHWLLNFTLSIRRGI